MMDINEQPVRDFASRLVPLEDGEVYLIFGVARKKYDPSIPSSEHGTGYQVLRSTDPDYVLNKVRHCACELEAEGYSPAATAIYMDLNPKSAMKAFAEVCKHGLDSIATKQVNNLRSLGKKWFSCLHTNNARHLYFIVDIDVKDENVLNQVLSLLGGDVAFVNNTQGGYHVVTHKTTAAGTTTYQKINKKIPKVEVKQEPQTPVPGTMQGGRRVEMRKGESG